MAWVLAKRFVPSGTVAKVGAGVELQDGWTDLSGNIWSITSGVLYPSSATDAWNYGLLVRPASEAAITSRIRVRITAGKGDPYICLRHSRKPAGASTCYALGVSQTDGKILGYSIVNGSINGLGSNPLASALVAGTDYWLEATATQNANNTTDLLVQRFAADGVTLIDQWSKTGDATSALQNVSGVPAMFAYLNGATQPGLTGFKETDTYTQQSAASTYTITGASSGALASEVTLTVTPDAPVTVDTTITLASSVSGDTFSAKTLTFLAGSSTGKTTKLKPFTAGARTITGTNDGSLTDPAGKTYTALDLKILTPDSAAMRFSPRNWVGDSGRGGSVSRRAWAPGSYFEAVWTTSSSPTGVILIPTTSTGAKVTYFLNGTMYYNVPATGNIDISSQLPANSAVQLLLFFNTAPQNQQWNGGLNTLTIQGIQIDTGSTAGVARKMKGWHEVDGDSLFRGILADNVQNDSFLHCCTYLFTRALMELGYDVCINACGYNGWEAPGNDAGDVPAFHYTSNGTYDASKSRSHLIDSGVSALDSAGRMSGWGGTGQEPQCVWVSLAGNDARINASATDVTNSVRDFMTKYRAWAPDATICVFVEFILYSPNLFAAGPSMAAAVKAGFAAYQQAYPNDLNILLIDFGASFTNEITASLYGGQVVHGNALMHAIEAARMIPYIAKAENRKLMALMKRGKGVVHRMRHDADGAFTIDATSGAIAPVGTLTVGKGYPVLVEQLDTDTGYMTGFVQTITPTAAQ